MVGNVVNIKPLKSEQAIRSSGFSLLAQNLSTPIILQQPSDTFTQTTWIQSNSNNKPVYQNIPINTNTIGVLQGTNFNFGVTVVDPNNESNFNDQSKLLFKWKKDDSYLTKENLSNNGFGSNKLIIDNATPDLSGDYVCEVSNDQGITTSNNITIEVVDPLNSTLLYKNLIQNADGESGLTNWQADPDLTVTPFMQDAFNSSNFGSYRLGDLPFIDPNKLRDLNEFVLIGQPPKFLFSNGSNGLLFYNIQKKLESGTLYIPEQGALEADGWAALGLLPQIIINEDYNESPLGGFFPGPLWLDKYNGNGYGDGLYLELTNETPTYYTRNNITFEKFSGKQQVQMTQTVDVTQATNFIDGNVYGVNYLTSQFFAYIGAGITGYQVKLQTVGGEKILNYYIDTIERLYNNTVNTSGTGWKQLDANSYLEVANFSENTPDGQAIIQRIFKSTKDSLNLEDWTTYANTQTTTTEDGDGNTTTVSLLSTTYYDVNRLVFDWLQNINYQNYSAVDNVDNFFDSAYTNWWNYEQTNNTAPDTFTADNYSNDSLGFQRIFLDILEKLVTDYEANKAAYLNNPIIKKYQLERDSTIEITPLVNDVTTVVLDYLDQSGKILKTETINGPDAKDVWAIKEKVYFPGTLYGLYEFVQPSGKNNITVFGQKYTDTIAIEPLFYDGNGEAGRGAFYYPTEAVMSSITDKNVSYLMRNYRYFALHGGTYPSDGNWTIKERKKDRALQDKGAAAMFGLSRNVIVPIGTRSVNITVKFSHNGTTIIKDTTPELKGWTNQDLYADEFTQTTGTSLRLSDYGAPRCGITKMKFMLGVNDIQPQSGYPCYEIPPDDQTILGLQKKRYLDPKAYNSADATEFLYKPILPSGPPKPPKGLNIYSGSLGVDNTISGKVEYAQANAKYQTSQVSGSK